MATNSNYLDKENIVFGLNENNLINIARINIITIVVAAIDALFIKYCDLWLTVFYNFVEKLSHKFKQITGITILYNSQDNERIL